MRPVRFRLGIGSLFLCGVAPLAQESPTREPDLERRVAVPLHDGRLDIDELLRALLAAYELDGDTLNLSTARIDLRGARGALLLLGGRKLLLDTVRFRRDLAHDELIVTIDRVRTREVRRQLRERLTRFAGGLAGRDVAARRYELNVPSPLDPQRPLVVLVHGIESTPESLAELRAFLCAPARGCQVASFTFPNDEAIDRVAAEFGTRLRALGEQPIAIVAHSMGGLVARAVVEDPELDPGNVRTLVLSGTPNRGSDLAGFRFVLEAADVLRDVEEPKHFASELLDACIDHWRDGLGEAGGDVLPGSVFLTELAARSRNPRVDYHLVLGTKSLLQAAQLEAVRREATARLRGHTVGDLVRPRLDAWLSHLDELVDGRGDGAVSVVSGNLDGVETLLVPLDHLGLVRARGVFGSSVAPEDHPVFRSVAAWVEGPRR